MSLSTIEIESVLEGWGPLIGTRVQKVRAVAGEPAVVLELWGDGETSQILIAATVGATRLYRIEQRPPSPPEPGSFVMLLRKYIVGARLAAIAQTSGDRVVRLVFSKGEHQLQIIAELSGVHGNLFVVDSDDRILAAIVPNKSATRRLVPGATWSEPGPANNSGRLRTGWPTDAPDQFIEDAYGESLGAASLDTLRRKALQPVRKALKKAERAIASVGRDLKKIEGADLLREEADLLQQAWGQTSRGATEIVITDWESGEPRTITLDPKRDLNENIQARYHRYRRLKRGQEVAGKRRDALKEECEHLKRQLAELEQADREGLESLATEVSSRTRKRSKARPEVRKPYHEFTSTDGLAIYVGRGSKDNDELTFQVARGNDMWLHAADSAGSHVIIRSGKSAPPRRTLEEAALLAAHYSKVRTDAVVTVNYTQRKHVRKPRGAAPGMVSIGGTRAIDVRMDAARIKGLFATRR
ncbi:MAG: putative ribosome quality control (RQC) complex YloA/Tae2 family protein [Bradymonadia bacterium]